MPGLTSWTEETHAPSVQQRTAFSLLLVCAALAFSQVGSAAAASWMTNAPMNIAHHWHTATLLPNGKVLVAGGSTNYASGLGYQVTASTEVFDPANGFWAPSASMLAPRQNHTATVLPNGQVLVAGGMNNGYLTLLAAAELYDPATETWTAAAPMSFARDGHTATLLPSGQVLVAGGSAEGLTTAEIYDPAFGTWSRTGNLNSQHQGHTATLLPNGQVLLAGGGTGRNIPSTSAELYDPATGAFTAIAPMTIARLDHTATLLANGKVLVAGGCDTNIVTTPSAELYDPDTGLWTPTGPMNAARFRHTATLLPNGQVLVTGGDYQTPSSAEVYDPASGTWTTTNLLNGSRSGHTATLLPGGQVLLAGGIETLANFLSSSERLDWASGGWTGTGSLHTGRYAHSALLLPSGKVLAMGGAAYSGPPPAELYDPATGGWATTASPNNGRTYFSATLLGSGKVLVAGGQAAGGTLTQSPICEVYDPQTEKWTATGPLTFPRGYHTATLLSNGKVLMAGGEFTSRTVSSYPPGAELYEPSTGTWQLTGQLTCPRALHTATKLLTGQVLVAGGETNSTSPFASTELYEPATGKWSLTGPLNTPRAAHCATLLPNGMVLVCGGEGSSGNLASAELFDPARGRWTPTGAMTTKRSNHTATLLRNGKVLVMGGFGDGGVRLSSAEVFDPLSGVWTPAGAITSVGVWHTATLLADGRVMLAAGYLGSVGGSAYSSGVSLYDPGLGFSAAWQPHISSATSPLSIGANLGLTGSGFQGVSESSGGNAHSSSSGYPLVQLRSLENEQSAFLLATHWQTNSFASVSVAGFPPGYALATVFVNGIPSTGSIVNISVPTPTTPTLVGANKLGDGSFHFAFTNSPGAVFGVLTTTNPAQPLTSWTALGGVSEISPGQFSFTDPQAAGSAQRFYRVVAP